jgi:hypothetical protein
MKAAMRTPSASATQCLEDDMIPTKTDYPVFEANQVLTNEHLNRLLTYLDEQNRLTRVTLHGIGVGCGLEVSVVNNTITISKGYGVTSEGYLAFVGTEDFVADKYQAYTVPNEGGDELFVYGNYSFWELLDKGHNNYDEGTALTATFLKGKVVLLFVELLEENLKNCSPNSCDDKGKKVDITLRKLLISEAQLNELNKTIADILEKARVRGDFFPDLTARLNLPDLRLPRLDVPATNMVDAQTIFDAYRKILSPKALPVPPAKILFERVGSALDEAYTAFKPILPPLPANHYLSEKVKNIKLQYEDTLDDSTVIFSQYFYDFLDDVIQAYDEFRWKAIEFMALCSPPVELFPRHLELGETGKGNFAGKKVHRHYFRPSPALACQKKLGEEVQLLFERLRLMVESFNSLALVKAPTTKDSVKITPSKLGDIPLSEKAIPYYYDLKTTPSLPASWNNQTTTTGRPKAILGYNVRTEYHLDNDPRLLNYDLEKYNFFRIEGHLGLEWREVLRDLLNKIKQYRLPFDVVALNAHPTTATADILKDPLISSCLTNDLQVIFDAWSRELKCLMGDKIKAFTHSTLPGRPAKASPMTTDIPLSRSASTILRQLSPRINILESVETKEGTLGNVIATVLKKTSTAPSTTDKLRQNVTALLKEIPEINNLTISDYDVAIEHPLEVVMAMVDFSNSIPTDASDLKFTAISDRYKKLTTSIKGYRDKLIAYKPPIDKPVIIPEQKDQLLKELEDLLNNCLIKRLEGLGAELERRNKQIKEMIFFSKYVGKHPGIQHKAGVPNGGTFIVIFQETPMEFARPENEGFTTRTLDGEEIPGGKNLAADTGDRQRGFNIPETVVIADFFLPYRCCSDCPPMQFVLPAARPIFSLKPECSDKKGNAKVRLEFTYRTPPCEVKIDAKEYVALVDDVITLNLGKHTVVVRDAEGGISLPQEIEIFPRFTLEPENPVCSNDNKTYTVRIKVTNGQLPLFIAGTEVTATISSANVHHITAGPFNSGQPVRVEIGDSSICPPVVINFDHTCVPLVTNPDRAETPYNTPVTIEVLANDTGSDLKVTGATLLNSSSGTVVINNGKTITYTPVPEIEKKDVAITYTVMDSYGRTKDEIATVHVGKNPCDLPCDGNSRRCAYRLWIQPPVEESLYEAYSQDRRSNIKFRYNGNEIELPGTTDLLMAGTDQLNQDFHVTMGRIIERLNAVINRMLDGKFGPLSKPRLLITYEPDNDDPFGIFLIEYFVCETFSIEFDYSFTRSAQSFNLTMRYTNGPTASGEIFNGAILESSQSIRVPAFACSERNQCTGIDFQRLCEGPDPRPSFSINVRQGKQFLFLLAGKVEDVDENEITAWVWDILTAQPTEPFYGGKNIEVSMQNPSGVVRLTVITKKGCFGFSNQEIRI